MDIATGVQKVRRFVASLSVVTLLASLFVANVAQAATYSDVPTDAWFYTYVEQLAAAGILDTTQTMYRPADLANRAEAAKLLVEAAGLTIDTSAGPSFTDVAPGAWYYQYVETAAKNGVVSGYKDAAGNLTGKFGPGDAVTREQFSKMAVNALALTSDVTGGPHFPDVGTDRWSYDFVETLYNWSVVDGYPDGTFGPTKNINRAEIAKMVVGAMNPVKRGTAGAFNAQTAAATSATMVDVMFSQDVDATTGAVAANYTIKDANGTDLAVTAAAVSADKVTLTTASQTANKPYVLTVTGVKSASGKSLDNGIVNFNGYNPLGTGGPLTVALSATSPATVSAPKGASGIVFSCFDFTAGSSAVVVQSLTVHRFGAGKETDFSNVYLYNDALRLTTGRTINSQTQTADFSNINVNIAAGGVAKLCVVGDFSTTAQAAGEHGFEIVAATAITTNASSVSGTFPVKGNVMRVAGGTAGTVKIGAYGSLGEGVVGQAGLRFAQARLEADNNEDLSVQRIAIYVRGSIRPTDMSNLKMYVEGSADVLATADTVGSNALATFVLTKPLLIQKGQIKNVYFTADVKGRNGDDIKTYLDESTDLLAVGQTFGFGAQVDRATTAIKQGYDGVASLGAGDGFSRIVLKGSQFTLAFNGPSAQDVATGQKSVHCLDLTITNNGPAVDIKNWKVEVGVNGAKITGGAVAASPAPTAAGGLINNGTVANYTLFKLATLNSTGGVDRTLLSGELPVIDATLGNDSVQQVVLSGSATVDAGASWKTSIVMDIANTAGSGDKIKCTLLNLTTLADAVKVGSDALGANAISPSSDIAGNQLTVTSAGLTFGIAPQPSSATLVRGTNGASVLGITARSGTSLDNTLQSLSFQADIDGNGDGTFTAGTDGGVNVRDVVSNLALYDGNTKVSSTLSSGNIDATTSKVIFTNMNLWIPKGTTKTLTLKGDINNNTPNGVKVKFGIVTASDITSIDQNGQTVSGVDVSQAGNCSPAGAGTACLALNSGVVMTIASAGTPSVVQSGSPNGQLYGGGVTGKVLAKMKFTMSNAGGTLEDFALGVQGDAASLTRVYVADSTCTTKLADTTGYPVTGSAAQVTSAAINLPVGDTTLCFLGDVASVKNSPTDSSGNVLSGSLTGLFLRDITRLTSGGSEVSSTVNSTNIGVAGVDASLGADATAAQNALCVTTASIGTMPVPGNVLSVGSGTNGSELVYVAAAPGTSAVVCPGGTTKFSVVRGMAGTTPRAFASGTVVRRSKLGVLTTNAAVKAGDLVVKSLGAGTTDNAKLFIATVDAPASNAAVDTIGGTTAQTAVATFLCSTAGPANVLVAGDIIAIDNEYELVTANTLAAGVGPDCAAGEFETAVFRGMYGSTAAAHASGTAIWKLVGIVPVAGSTFLAGGNAGYFAGDLTSAFTLHGNFFKVRKAVPTQSVDSSVVSGTLSTGAQTPLMAVKIDVAGQGQFELTPGNANTVTFVLTYPVAGTVAGYCALYDGSGNDLGSIAAPATGVATPIVLGASGGGDPGVISPTGLTIPAGSSAVLTLKCGTATGAGRSVGTQMTAMTWGDGTVGNANITTDGGLLLSKFPITGPSFTSGF